MAKKKTKTDTVIIERPDALKILVENIDALKADILAGKYDDPNCGVILATANFDNTDKLFHSRAYYVAENIETLTAAFIPFGNNIVTRVAITQAITKTNKDEKAN